MALLSHYHDGNIAVALFILEMSRQLQYMTTWPAAFPAQYAPRYQARMKQFDTVCPSATPGSDHLIRMHLTGEPSAPTSLRGKQWRLYNPTGTSSSFRPSTGIMSWQNKESKSTNGSNAMHILDTKKRLLEIKQARKFWNQQTTVTRLGNSQYWTAVFWSGNLLYWNSGTNRMKHFCH